jgi:hypothetical protein
VGICGDAVVRFHRHAKGGARIVCITQSALEKAGSLFVVTVFTLSPVPEPLDVVIELVKAEKYPWPPLFRRMPVTGPVAPPPLIEDTDAVPPSPDGT